MFYIFNLSNRDSVLSTKVYPPIILEDNKQWIIGLIDLFTYNTIPNVDKSNNLFYIDSHKIEIPEGSYEVKDIEQYISNKIVELENKPDPNTNNIMKSVSTHNTNKPKDPTALILRINNHTLKCEIKSNKEINFQKLCTIGSLLGFENKKSVSKTHISKYPINISKVNSIGIDCNIVTNSYNKDKNVHILHMFYPNVPLQVTRLLKFLKM